MTEAQITICKTCLNRKKGDFNSDDICNIRGFKLKPEEVCSYYDKDKNVIPDSVDKKTYLKPNADRAKNAIIAILVVMTMDIITGISSYFQLNLLNDLKNGVFVSDEIINSNDLRERIIAGIYIIALIVSIVLFIQWFRRAYYNLQVRTGNCKHSNGWAAGSWFVPIISIYRPYQIMIELTEKTSNLLQKASGKDINPEKEVVGIWWALWILTNYIGNYTFKKVLNGETVEDFINLTLVEIVNSVFGVILALVTVYMIKSYATKETNLVDEEKNSVFTQ